jgi:hypothetical protein
MHTWTYFIEFGWCGWGCSGGLIPEIRFGFVRIAYAGACRGSFIDDLRARTVVRTAKGVA